MTSARVSKSKGVAALQSNDQLMPEAVEREIKDHLGLVAEMTREFTSSLDFAVVEQSALERIANYVGAEAASLFLVTDAGDSLICSACYGPVDITGLAVPIASGVVGRSVSTRQGIMVRDTSKDSDFGGNVDAKT